MLPPSGCPLGQHRTQTQQPTRSRRRTQPGTQLMKQAPATEQGCFHAAYPSLVWEKLDCATGLARVPRHIKPTDGEPEVVGNGGDYVGEAKGLISSAAGDFQCQRREIRKERGRCRIRRGWHSRLQRVLGAAQYERQDRAPPHVPGIAAARFGNNSSMRRITLAPARPRCSCSIGCSIGARPPVRAAGANMVQIAMRIAPWLPAPDIPITSLSQLELGTSVQAGGI